MKRILRSVFGLPVLILVITLALAARSTACPMCSETLPQQEPQPAGNDHVNQSASNSSGAGLAEGFYYSILLMLLVTFTAMAGLGTMLYCNRRPPQNQPNNA